MLCYCQNRIKRFTLTLVQTRGYCCINCAFLIQAPDLTSFKIANLPPVSPIFQAPLPSIADGNKRSLRTSGLTELTVRLGTRVSKVQFNVCERLTAPLIFGRDYADKFIEAVYPRRHEIELDEGFTITIVRKLLPKESVAS